MSAVAETNPPADAAAPPLCALVLDDMAMNRRITELLLLRLGCRVVTVDSVTAALAQLRAQEVDLVVTDVEMPDIDGLEAIALFRAADAEAHPGRARPLKLLACSGGRVGMVREDYLAAGFDDYLEKPVVLEKLRGILRRLQAGGC